MLPPPPKGLYPRGTLEHNVLANCVDEKGVWSSQVAYFFNAPTNKPDFVGIVTTEFNKTALWDSGTTSAVFDDGNVFTTTLSKVNTTGALAGTGVAKQGTFNCYTA